MNLKITHNPNNNSNPNNESNNNPRLKYNPNNVTVKVQFLNYLSSTSLSYFSRYI